MTVDFNTLISKYIKENPNQISEEHLLEMVKLYYTFVREEIESGELKQIRIKYFGAFRPLMGKLKHLKYNINWEKFNQKEKDRYIKLFENYEKLVEEIEKES